MLNTKNKIVLLITYLLINTKCKCIVILNEN